MAHQLLIYEYVSDMLDRRAPHREAHLAAIRKQAEAGHVVMAGAVGNPPNGGAIVFSGVDTDHVTAFVESDPYVRAELVKSWRVEPYTLVVGG